MYVQCIPSPEKLVPEAPQIVEMQEPEKVSATLLAYLKSMYGNVHVCMYVRILQKCMHVCM